MDLKTKPLFFFLNLDLNLKINPQNVFSPTKSASSFTNKNTSSSNVSPEYSVRKSAHSEISPLSFTNREAHGQAAFDEPTSKTTIKAFCKYCVNELSIFQIGFDEAIQFCTNINVNILFIFKIIPFYYKKTKFKF